ncbi:MAG: murein hydrolase activator EnvC family protein [Acidobacteriota bacterium]
MRLPRLGLVLVLVLGLDADASRRKHEHEHAHAAPPPPAAAAIDPHAALADQLSEESAVLAKTLATVDDKLSHADALRLRHLRAAARILHAPLPADATADDRMAYARRLAAARLLLDRDASERALLADESQRLHTSDARLANDTSQLARVALPADLAWPAHGKIARAFGTFEHERSHATLSRRGIDIEVEDRAPAVAPEAGTVRYAGPIRGLDHGVILDHGGYYTVIAKLAETSLPLGAKLARGDRLGHAAHHRVYLEVRAKLGPGGLPIDPAPLLR